MTLFVFFCGVGSVGFRNHRYFYLFLVYMVVACVWFAGMASGLAWKVFVKNEVVSFSCHRFFFPLKKWSKTIGLAG